MAYAVVTGASGGIGLCLAKELAARKYDLLLIARSADKLASACETLRSEHGIQAGYLALDLSDRSSLDQIIKWIDQKQADVSVLINNAGYGLWGTVETMALSKLENMIALNISALSGLTHRMIPYLKKKTPSYILNVASTAAYQAVP